MTSNPGNPRILQKVLLALACLALLALPLFAQSTSSIVGTVKDSSGAVIPGATVTLTNPATADKRTAVTEGNGGYRFMNIPPASYRLEVELKGFKHLTRDVVVQVESSVLIDAVLEIGNMTEVVEVTSATPLLDTQSATISHVVEAKTVQEMPINGRNVMNLIGLVPGVVPQGATVGATIASNQSAGHTNNWAFNNYQIGGGIAGYSSAYLDGAPTIALGNNTVVLIATQDAVQEFRVATNNVGVEYGRFGGGVVNMATKSGANEFHGSAYEYFRNKVLNANQFFANKAGQPRPAFNQNQYGATIGGPIWKDKTFFFFTWEQFRAKIGSTVSAFIPTPAQLRGDFSADLGAATTTINPCTGDYVRKGQIFDPKTTTTVNGVNCRLPFAGNLVPTNRIDYTANVMGNVLKYWPTPNSTSSAGNYASTMNPGGTQQQFNARVDQNLSDKHRFFTRFTYWTVNDISANRYNNMTAGAASNQATHQAVLGDTYSFSPTMVMENRLSFSRAYYDDNPPNVGTDLAQFGSPWATLNPLVTFQELPAPNIAGLAGWPGMNVTTRHYRDTWALSSNWTKVSGKHTFKFGGEIRFMDYMKNENNQSSGSFSFDAAFTSFDGTTGSNSGGVATASFVLGYPATGTILATNWSSMFSWYQGYYAGDTWQVNNKLTLNYGVRWEIPGAFAERNDNATILLPSKTDPLSTSTGMALKGQLALVNSTDWPDRITQKTRQTLFAPRFGLAYRVTNSTVIRAGYGISYLPMDMGINGSGSFPSYSPINSASTAYVPAGNNPLIPLNSLSNPFPSGGVSGTTQQSILQPKGRSFNLASLEGFTIGAGAPYDVFGYTQQWNLNVQQELGSGLMFEIGYSGAKGTHLPAGELQLNQLDSKYFSMGSALSNTVPNPMAGKLPGSPYNGATIRAGQLLRPYPQFDSVIDTAAMIGITNYHSMQARVEKRFGAAGIIQGSYTRAKFMGNTDSFMNFLEGGGNAVGTIQNFYNTRGEYSLTSFDIPNRFVTSYVLELPMGKGKKLASGATGVVGGLISGWSINGIVTFQSGYPLALKAQNTTFATTFGGVINYNNFTTQIRPNRVAGCDPVKTGRAQDRLSAWFNTACFSQPGSYELGNESRTDPVLRGHGINNFDFTASKMTAITERVKLQFKAEFFNIFNRVQFAVTNTQMTSVFGTVTAQKNQPRLVQFALRLVF
jgi:hypothetical protein